MNKLKSNFLYSSFLTTAGYIFPILTFPYITRVLGPANLGLVNFVDGIINYAILIASMGVGATGIKAVAANKNLDYKEVFSSLLTLNIITTISVIMILLICTFTIGVLRNDIDLIGIGIVKIIFNAFLIEWFFKGLEDFRYITLRSLFIRIIYVISIFIFVRNKGDITIYYAITVGAVVVNALINLTYAQKFVSFSFKAIDIKSYYKSFFKMGLYMILISFYNTLNVVFLGFMADSTQVAYYTTATKIYSILLSVFSAFTGVMLPRMSSLISSDKIEEFRDKISKSIRFLLSFCPPVLCYVIINARYVVSIIAGNGYEGAILPMQIVMALLFIVGFNQIFIVQILMPMNKENIIVRNTLIASIVGILLNLIVVPKLFSVGSAIVLVSAELIQYVLGWYACRNIVRFKTVIKLLLKHSAYLLLMCVSLFMIKSYLGNGILVLVSSGLLTLFTVILLANKNFPNLKFALLRKMNH